MLALRFKRSAEKELLSLPTREQKRLGELLLALRSNPFPAGITKLQGREGYRIRHGDYRAIYSVDHDAGIVTVIAIGHRRDISLIDADPRHCLTHQLRRTPLCVKSASGSQGWAPWEQAFTSTSRRTARCSRSAWGWNSSCAGPSCVT